MYDCGIVENYFLYSVRTGGEVDGEAGRGPGDDQDLSQSCRRGILPAGNLLHIITEMIVQVTLAKS